MTTDLLHGAVVLLTGANGGMGQAFLAELSKRGVAKIYVCARSLAAATDAAAAATVPAVPLQLDITDAGSVQAAARVATDVTILLNNAGVNHNTALLRAPDLQIAREEIEVNYLGTLTMCRVFAPVLQASGAALIVNMLSILARVALPLMGSLCASKAAGLSMTQSLRGELAARGIRVVAVMPGAIDTRMTAGLPPPKMAPADAARDILDAIAAGEEDIYPGDMARDVAAGLAQDAKAVERQFGAIL